MVTKLAAIVIFALSVLLSSLSFAIAGDEFPPDEAWGGETVGQIGTDLYVVAESPNSPIAGESSGVREMRKLLRPNWNIGASEVTTSTDSSDSSDSGESTHEKGKPTGDGTLRADPKPSAAAIGASVFDQSKKADRLH